MQRIMKICQFDKFNVVFKEGKYFSASSSAVGLQSLHWFVIVVVCFRTFCRNVLAPQFVEIIFIF